MDPFWGMQEDPDTWATARYFGLPSATILSYYLGLKGGTWELMITSKRGTIGGSPSYTFKLGDE